MQPKEAAVGEISVDELKVRLIRGGQFVFVDARNPKDWAASEIKMPSAIRLPPAEVDQHLKETSGHGSRFYSRNGGMFDACRTGIRKRGTIGARRLQRRRSGA